MMHTLLRATINLWHLSWAWSQIEHNISWSKPLIRRYSPWDRTCSAVSFALPKQHSKAIKVTL